MTGSDIPKLTLIGKLLTLVLAIAGAKLLHGAWMRKQHASDTTVFPYGVLQGNRQLVIGIALIVFAVAAALAIWLFF